MQGFIDRWLEKHFGEHYNFGPKIKGWPMITVYGWNAMHGAVNVRLPNSWLCFKIPTKCFGKWWPAYCYISKDATPVRAQWIFGRKNHGY